jgi:glycosyltransferase involved in cell wall biosynthesis
VKYLEAGLVGVSTIASPRPDFCRAIEDGRNGFLADEKAAWRERLDALVASPALRREVGERASADVRANHTTYARREELARALGAASVRTAPRLAR